MLLLRLRRTFEQRGQTDTAFLEDVVQDALLKTLDSLDQFEGRSRFETWATTIAIRVAYTELRRRRFRDVSLDQFLDDTRGDGNESAGGEPAPTEQVARDAMIDDMYRIINTKLTEKQRTALLAELKGMPLEEIGRRMGSSRNAIYKLTHDARKRLKTDMESAGYSAADLRTS